MELYDRSIGSVSLSPVPVGFRFDPTDQQLVGYYLLHKVTGAAPPPHDMPEFDLFGELEPWEIWTDPKLKVHHDIAADCVYLFTKLKKLSAKRFDRKVGSGTWSEGEPSKLIYDDEDEKEAIGRKRKYRYENKGSEQHGAWYMDEYSTLAAKYDHDQYVICRLRKNDRSSNHSAPPLPCTSAASTGSKKRKSACPEIDHEKPTKKRARRRGKAVQETVHDIIAHNPEPEAQCSSSVTSTTTTAYDNHQIVAIPDDDDDDQELTDWITSMISFDDPHDCSFDLSVDQALESLPINTIDDKNQNVVFESQPLYFPPGDATCDHHGDQGSATNQLPDMDMIITSNT